MQKEKLDLETPKATPKAKPKTEPKKRTRPRPKPEDAFDGITTTRVNLRKEPSLSADVLDILEKDTELLIIQIYEGWATTAKGFVASEFIKKKGSI